jgi:hypothetical protein
VAKEQVWLNNMTRRNITVLEEIVKGCSNSADCNDSDRQALNWIEQVIGRLQQGKGFLDREKVEYDDTSIQK